ncbi:MAG TPA: transglycosylase domain-containing protein [Solirubrobacteraceae bacterium]|jgi:penicillin-binding protein 1A|nr:transglycosylase domain-containing protein [Solirubrobacteraceae bacterium]
MPNEAPTISTASRISDETRPATPPAPPKPKPRLKRLRFLAILVAALLLGLVSFVFGMFIAVTSDLPSLTKFALLKDARSSVLLDDLGHPIGIVSQQHRVIVTPTEIPQVVKDAVISIEDKRFQTNSGIDIRGIGRAFVQDTLHKGSGSVQGASTIEQQFIKNALQAQSHRTIFEKLREAALAYQLSHKWSKDKIITAYLNTIYFGNGAYGIESAAQTYFGADVNHVGCGMPGHPLCVQQLQPWEAALLAGIIRSPTAYDPANHPVAATERRNLVLREMLNQGYINRSVYDESVNQALPASKDVLAPREQKIEGVDVGYFTSWVRQQVIERYGAPRAFDGGLRITTTLDLELQRSAEQAVGSYLANPSGPTASLVAIENSTGEVRAMVGGRNYDESPFNLATSGERQPGSAFKAFDLAAALESGISPESVWSSKVKTFYVPSSHGTEKFVVHNDENLYAGSNTLTGATAYSDNSVYAEVGLKVGTHRIALLAHRMGITTPLSTNPAMTIGGLTVGVTPLDMAHAYETIAHGGRRVSGTLAEAEAPVGIQEVDAGGAALPDGHHRDKNQVVTHAVLPPAVAATETSMLETVLQYGTARAASLGQFAAGKTGTTTNFGDAWFIGWNSKYTVAVWVGYPNSLVPMTTEFNGKPVMGGTFPALIWHDFMTSAFQIDKTRAESSAAAHAGNGSQPGTGNGTGETATPSSTSSTAQPASPSGGAKSKGQSGGEGGGGAATPSPEHAAGPATPPANTPATPPSSPSPSPPSTTPSQPPSGGTSPTGGVSPSG